MRVTPFLSLSCSHLYMYTFHAVHPSPRRIAGPTVRMLAAVEVSLSTNNHLGQPGQVFTQEALAKVQLTGHFEVSGQRSLTFGRSALLWSEAAQLTLSKHDTWIAHRCTVAHDEHDDDKSFTRKSEDRFLGGNRTKAIHECLSSLSRKLNFSHIYRLQHFPAVGNSTPLGGVLLRCQQDRSALAQKIYRFSNGQGWISLHVSVHQRFPKEHNRWSPSENRDKRRDCPVSDYISWCRIYF